MPTTLSQSALQAHHLAPQPRVCASLHSLHIEGARRFALSQPPPMTTRAHLRVGDGAGAAPATAAAAPATPDTEVRSLSALGEAGNHADAALYQQLSGFYTARAALAVLPTAVLCLLGCAARRARSQQTRAAVAASCSGHLCTGERVERVLRRFTPAAGSEQKPSACNAPQWLPHARRARRTRTTSFMRSQARHGGGLPACTCTVVPNQDCKMRCLLLPIRPCHVAGEHDAVRRYEHLAAGRPSNHPC